jgi:hypothetical protein
MVCEPSILMRIDWLPEMRSNSTLPSRSGEDIAAVVQGADGDRAKFVTIAAQLADEADISRSGGAMHSEKRSTRWDC